MGPAPPPSNPLQCHPSVPQPHSTTLLPRPLVQPAQVSPTLKRYRLRRRPTGNQPICRDMLGVAIIATVGVGGAFSKIVVGALGRIGDLPAALVIQTYLIAPTDWRG